MKPSAVTIKNSYKNKYSNNPKDKISIMMAIMDGSFSSKLLCNFYFKAFKYSVITNDL